MSGSNSGDIATDGTTIRFQDIYASTILTLIRGTIGTFSWRAYRFYALAFLQNSPSRRPSLACDALNLLVIHNPVAALLHNNLALHINSSIPTDLPVLKVWRNVAGDDLEECFALAKQFGVEDENREVMRADAVAYLKGQVSATPEALKAVYDLTATMRALGV